MYIFKNAWLNITRNKSRNILIGIIVLVIACAATVTLAIKNTASSLIESYKNAYQVEATISFDRSSMKEDFDFSSEDGMESMKDKFDDMESLSEEDINKYADNEYVNSYYYTNSVGLNSTNIEKVSSDFSFGKNDNVEGRNKENANYNNGQGNENDFTLIGYSTADALTEFITGSYQISEKTDDAWDKIFDGNYCAINKELADLNELKLGDNIILNDPNDEGKSIELSVVAIYEEDSEEDVNSKSMFSNSANSIITNVDTISKVKEFNSDLKFNVNPVFVLDSYDDASEFEEWLHNNGLDEYYMVTTNEEEVNSATSSISNVSSFATTFLVLTLIIGAIVLLVINQINVRERKYEIGVLRTIGMRKSLLTLQFVIELLIVSLVALVIGAGIGAYISKPVGNSLLQNEINSSQENSNKISENFGGDRPSDKSNLGHGNMRGVVNVQAYDSIDAVVDIKVIMELLSIGIILTIIGSMSSVISIERFSPLQILKERS